MNHLIEWCYFPWTKPSSSATHPTLETLQLQAAAVPRHIQLNDAAAIPQQRRQRMRRGRAGELIALSRLVTMEFWRCLMCIWGLSKKNTKKHTDLRCFKDVFDLGVFKVKKDKQRSKHHENISESALSIIHHQSSIIISSSNSNIISFTISTPKLPLRPPCPTCR